MPAILTHDFFGRDVLDAFGSMDSATLDERDAFLLGNQGPDPLFYLVIHPAKARWHSFGTLMHKQSPTELLFALSRSLDILEGYENDIGHAYAQGFLCHYALDSRAHPLIYAKQRAICDAGVANLNRKNSREVHAEIERELDEMMLFAKRGETIREYSPASNTLDANEAVLRVVQKMYSFVALTVYGQILDARAFPAGVRCYRAALRGLYSPQGIKRRLIGLAEGTVRRYSFLAAMAHRPEEVHSSWYANPDHETWIHPFTGEERTSSFWDIYDDALEFAASSIAAFESGPFSLDDAREITHDINFSGEPTAATLLIEA